MQYQDYYRVLGVPRDAPAAEIKSAFRKLARKYHPDISKEADAEARMKEINEAYAVLSDAERRAAYDQLGANAQAGSVRPVPGRGTWRSGGTPLPWGAAVSGCSIWRSAWPGP